MTYPEKVPAKFKKDNKKIQGIDGENEIDIGLCAVEIIVAKKISEPTLILQNTFAQLECDDETNGALLIMTTQMGTQLVLLLQRALRMTMEMGARSLLLRLVPKRFPKVRCRWCGERVNRARQFPETTG